MEKNILRMVFCCLLIFLLSTCGKPTLPCGAFTYTGTALPAGGGATVNLDFNFSPSVCSSTCNCQTICYVQIIRAIDHTTGAFLQPNSDQTDRMVTGTDQPTLNGWSLDRLSGRNWGYYGRNNDGSFASTLTPGSNTSAATLRDVPSGWPSNYWVDFVSVPVCIGTGSPCINNLLGYYYWLFVVGSDGHNGDPFHEIGVDWNKNAFDAAVGRWNATAPALGKTVFPAFTRMAE